MSAEISIVVPTYNEKGNIAPLISALNAALKDLSWEVVFVDDDSPDGTSETLLDLARREPRVRAIRRLGRRGLASACIEGILSTSAPFVCVMDADLQHDETLIPDMLARLRRGDVDIAIGSRYVSAGGTGDLPVRRVRMSRLARRLCGLVTGLKIADPTSGFFMFRRPFFESVMRRLSGRGFQTLLDMLMSARSPVACAELPYTMRSRREGASKLSAGVIWDFFVLLAHKQLGRMIPTRFISFVAVGFSGVFVNLAALWVFHRLLAAAFLPAQALATLVAMTTNFILNNRFTYADRRLRGLEFLRGLFSYYLACAFGALINVAMAGWLFDMAFPWWLAGLLGAVAGAVWNYAVTAVITWRDPAR
ncbi:MAG: glycosyltransferase [Longimicrobiales bacterium]